MTIQVLEITTVDLCGVREVLTVPIAVFDDAWDCVAECGGAFEAADFLRPDVYVSVAVTTRFEFEALPRKGR